MRCISVCSWMKVRVLFGGVVVAVSPDVIL